MCSFNASSHNLLVSEISDSEVSVLLWPVVLFCITVILTCRMLCIDSIKKWLN